MDKLPMKRPLRFQESTCGQVDMWTDLLAPLLAPGANHPVLFA
jgi:hypothetical protein